MGQTIFVLEKGYLLKILWRIFGGFGSESIYPDDKKHRLHPITKNIFGSLPQVTNG